MEGFQTLSLKTTQGAKLYEEYFIMYIRGGEYLHIYLFTFAYIYKTDSTVCFQREELDGGGMEWEKVSL